MLKLFGLSHNVAMSKVGMAMNEYELTFSEIWKEYNVKLEKHDSNNDEVDGGGVDTWTDMWWFVGNGMAMNELYDLTLPEIREEYNVKLKKKTTAMTTKLMVLILGLICDGL